MEIVAAQPFFQPHENGQQKETPPAKREQGKNNPIIDLIRFHRFDVRRQSINMFIQTILDSSLVE